MTNSINSSATSMVVSSSMVTSMLSTIIITGMTTNTIVITFIAMVTARMTLMLAVAPRRAAGGHGLAAAAPAGWLVAHPGLARI
jgi:hypothetical protein